MKYQWNKIKDSFVLKWFFHNLLFAEMNLKEKCLTSWS